MKIEDYIFRLILAQANKLIVFFGYKINRYKGKLIVKDSAGKVILQQDENEFHNTFKIEKGSISFDYICIDMEYSQLSLKICMAKAILTLKFDKTLGTMNYFSIDCSNKNQNYMIPSTYSISLGKLQGKNIFSLSEGYLEEGTILTVKSLLIENESRRENIKLYSEKGDIYKKQNGEPIDINKIEVSEAENGYDIIKTC